jgi:hypothetical protein
MLPLEEAHVHFTVSGHPGRVSSVLREYTPGWFYSCYVSLVKGLMQFCARLHAFRIIKSVVVLVLNMNENGTKLQWTVRQWQPLRRGFRDITVQ